MGIAGTTGFAVARGTRDSGECRNYRNNGQYRNAGLPYREQAVEEG